MTPDERLRRIADYRARTVSGALIDMVPMQPQHTEAVLALRNADDVRFNLAQTTVLTADQHDGWYRGYLSRNDDIAWMIKRSGGDIIGTIALYAIDPDGKTAEKGRQVVDARARMQGPFTVESELMVLRIAFEALAMERVLATIRPENVKVISMHQRIGFRYSRAIELRATPYGEYALERRDFNPAPLEKLLQHWTDRNERTAG